MKVQILGIGCPKCKQVEANAREAVKNLGLNIEVEKITDVDKITDFGVMVTPALAIDGDIKVSGKIPSVEEIEKLLK
ncbi:MAG: TM0996/MTH895 family glutaredoxin-like protein [Actinobacteria bacterium]|nr:TM0996/MTH895 family glutaredoxin-like protein [Actinomycetota bacterium]